MFDLSYLSAELRRRAGRSLLTALALGVGVGLVVAVGALGSGLDRAQEEVLAPLTGVGTDLTVTRPASPDAGGPRGAMLDLRDEGNPGDTFTRTDFVTALGAMPASAIDRIRRLDGVEDAAGALRLNALTVTGKVPQGGTAGPAPATAPGAGGGQEQELDVRALSVTGVDVTALELAPVGPAEVVKGRYLRLGGRREAVLDVSYAKRNDLDLGDTVTLQDEDFEVVGLVRAPLGGSTSDAYLPLGELQRLSDREGKVNTVQVRATSSRAVAAVQRRIEDEVDGASVTTASDLADRVGGSLSDAKALSDRLGTVLIVVALVASVLIASLLTLSSVNKRTRELGTLKALGWPQRKVVRQVTGESVVQGVLGGALGALIGVATAAAVGAAGIALKAAVSAPSGGSRLAEPGAVPRREAARAAR